ncbi:hypothetical protein [Rhodoferax sp. GW822-FHT02A01]|uniref:hypothetical protein n=1 Tax=Rhodoferax sp. GW822-FHT02A01 TaxID=3141537 RepID=UPI00315CFAAF
MNPAFYLSAALVILGVIAIVFGPHPSIDPSQKIGYFGLLALGLGMLTFLIALALTHAN